jgi:exodeoxyribonuclease VII large subunit
MAHRGFQTLRSVVAQMAQRSDEAGARLAEAARQRARNARRRWEAPYAFLLHFDLHGRQERARLHWNRETTALGHRMHLALMGKRARMEPLAAELEHLSPRRILERGYAIIFDNSGKVVKEASQVSPGEAITAQLARGRLRAQVESAIPDDKETS